MATKKKEIRVKITAENKELFDALNSAVAGLKKFASAVAAIKKVKIGADGASEVKAALEDVEAQAKETADAVKGVGTAGAGGLDTGTKKVAEVGKALEAVEKKAEKAAKSIKKIGTQTGAGATGVKVSASTIKPAAVSTAGLDESAQKAAEVEKALDGVGAQAEKASRSIKKIGEHAGTGATGVKVSAQAFKGAADAAKGAGNEGARAGERVRSGAKRGATALQEAKQSASAFGQTLANVTIIAHGVFSVIGQFKDILTKAISPGVEYTKQMESARVGVAGILLSMTKLNGQQLQLNEGLAISEQAFKSLQQQSLIFGLSINDTAAAFQTIVGPGLAGLMTLEEISKFAVQGTKAVKSFGLDSMQVVQELRSMVSGDIDQNSQVAKAMGITAAGVAEAKETAGGLFKYLNDKLKGFTLAAGEIPKTIKGKTDLLSAGISLVSEAGFKPLINTAKGVFDQIIGYLLITTTKVDEFGKEIKTVEVNPELVATLNDVAEYLTDTAQKAVALGKATLNFLSPAVPLLKFIANHVVIIGAGFGTWIVAGVVISTIRGVGTAIMVVEGVLKTGAIAWRAYNLAIATGSTNMRAFTIATRVANVGLTAFKITIRSLLASTGLGLLAVGIGYLAEKMLELADNTDKAAVAKNRLTQGRGIGAIGSLGNLSAAHEGSGIGTVSSGDNDPYGGVSYGTWQLSSKQGSVTSFIKWLTERGYEAGPFLAKEDPFYDMGMAYEGRDLIPGTPEFTERWHAAVDKFGASFERAYAQYFKENYYDNFTKDLLKDFGFDAGSRSDAIQQVLFSTSVQHGTGGAYNVMQKAAELAGVYNISWLTDEQLIPYIYQARRNVFPKDTQRYNEEQQEAMNLLAADPAGLSLIDEKQTAKDLKEAERKYLEAIQEGTLQAYIAELGRQEQALQQQRSDGKIGDDDFFSQMSTILTDKYYAEIEAIKEKIKVQAEVLDNKNYSAADKKNAEAEIVKLNNEIAAKEADLKKSLDANNFEFQQAVLESMDEVLEEQIKAYTAQGELEKAANLELKKSENVKKLAKLVANKSEAAIKALEVTNADKVIEAQFSESTTNISYAIEDMQLAQGKMIQGVVDGTTSVADSVKQFQTEFDTKILADVTKLNAALTEAKKLGLTARAREIETKLREIKGTVIDYITDLLKALDEDLQARIDAINADKDLTPLQKTDLIEAEERATAAKKAVAYRMQANSYAARGEKGDEQAASLAGELSDASRAATELETTLKKVERAGTKAFEEGLTEFLSESVIQCETLIDAILDLADTVLSAIRKVYSEALTKNIMAAMGLGGTAAIPESTLPAQTVATTTKNFAKGGSFVDSFGVVRGPGTSTSDNILAYAQKFGRFLNISNGEGILTGVAVRNLGEQALAALNAGVDPRRIFKNYATGGSLARTTAASIPGPQEIAANLTSGDTTVNLRNVNIFDRDEIIGGYMRGRSGERVLLNFVKNNAATVNNILRMR